MSVGIEVHHAVRRRRSLELSADVLSADAGRRPASIGLKFVVENVVLFTGTPSMMNSGSTLPLIVRSPRIVIFEPAPGSPDDCAT